MWGWGLSLHFATLVLTFNSRVKGDFQAREYVPLTVVKWQLYMLSKTLLKYYLLVELAGPDSVAETGEAVVFIIPVPCSTYRWGICACLRICSCKEGYVLMFPERAGCPQSLKSVFTRVFVPQVFFHSQLKLETFRMGRLSCL